MENKTQIIAETGKQELFIIREFDAPRELVFKAFSEPDLIIQWLGPCEMETVVEKLENKTHGSWRFIHKDPAGNAYAFNGVIHEVCYPERVIRTFEFEGLPERGHVSLEFLTLEKLENDRTKATIQVIYKSMYDRDGHIQSGMERGVVDSHQRLDALFNLMKHESR
ncbi:MAG: SRPBCC family protein [Chitinophagaceae bacterium]|nr:SRPBCC family protein [Chitinophagaceae bacterium]